MATDSVNNKLAARELPSAINSQKLLDEHIAYNKGKVRTRFPPEPNGYLHVGHAKSMNMNFELAFEKLGVDPENRETIFRYDDTNPEAESTEYIQSLREDVDWLGWNPVRVTYTSDYFQILYELAIKLIKNDKAYVCHQSKADIEVSREIARKKIGDSNFEGNPNSPWRNRPIEESLREFENMKKGKYSANEATLRLKMDMLSPNPNMWDQVAYRIKYIPHPHAGDNWCIYPTYDYTHCIIDSIEHIDYSICTLEFETRRESYFWVLEALDLYRPKVYEMSRLNVSYTVLSKRKLLKLVNSGFMRGWDDPRMPTIKGLRRRGYTPQILNEFCRDIGATRNANVVQYERLDAIARTVLSASSPRVMAVLDPLKLIISNRLSLLNGKKEDIIISDYHLNESKGSHIVSIEEVVFIDRSDFRMEDSEDYYGLAPNKAVGLKYAFRVRCVKVETDIITGEPLVLFCEALPDEDETKVKTSIQWVPLSTSVPLEVRLYNPLFLTEEPTDDGWEAELNPESEIVKMNAICDSSILKWKEISTTNHIQLERIGYFVFDMPTSISFANNNIKNDDKIVLNLTVMMRDSKPTVTNNTSGASRSRKEEQAKMARMKIPPEEFFKNQLDLYSQFDENGIPTHDHAGEKLSKNALKKVKKEWDTQKKLFESNKN
eukprot:gene11521-15434_t